MSEPLLHLTGITKSFRSAEGALRPVLERVDFSLAEGEIVSLLGPSGCGKSTLLRIMAGLIEPDAGELRYRGQPLYAPARGISMVFQSFALFPWLTVAGNVALGLEARGVAGEERERRVQAAVDLIGLSGFEGALPRELSGGMRQRVGIARALVTEPDVLLMDEAFSALDVLTGERLRDDILGLWRTGQLPIRGMVVVSHNIEEAVVMADRVLVMGTGPGRVRAQLAVPLARPRVPESLEVRSLVDELYAMVTAGRPRAAGAAEEPEVLHLTDRVPEADVGRIDGLLELLAGPPFDGRAHLPELAGEAGLTDSQLLPVAHAVALLRLGRLEPGELHLSPLGRRYVGGTHTLRQQIFGQQLLEHVPMIAHIRHSLEQDDDGLLPQQPFLQLLAEKMDAREAERVMRRLIEWGRHGEVFEYDFRRGSLSLPEEEGEDEGADAVDL